MKKKEQIHSWLCREASYPNKAKPLEHDYIMTILICCCFYSVRAELKFSYDFAEMLKCHRLTQDVFVYLNVSNIPSLYILCLVFLYLMLQNWKTSDLSSSVFREPKTDDQLWTSTMLHIKCFSIRKSGWVVTFCILSPACCSKLVTKEIEKT